MYELHLALEEARRYEAISAGHILIKGLTGSTTADSDIHTVKVKNYKPCPNCGLTHKPKKSQLTLMSVDIVECHVESIKNLFTDS